MNSVAAKEAVSNAGMSERELYERALSEIRRLVASGEMPASMRKEATTLLRKASRLEAKRLAAKAASGGAR